MAAKKKPAAKPTRWWACVDLGDDFGDVHNVPVLFATETSARIFVRRQNAPRDVTGEGCRFVAKRVEIREV